MEETLTKKFDRVIQAMTKDHMDFLPDLDEGQEKPYAILGRGILKSVILLVTVTILQLWFKEALTTGVEPLWTQILSIMLNLDQQEEPSATELQGHSFRPDIAIRRISPSKSHLSHLSRQTYNKIFITTVDFKNMSIARKAYRDRTTKDDYISELIMKGDPLLIDLHKNS